MTWWYDPWLGEMELTVGVEQVEVLKERPSEVSLVCWHCGVATHCGAALATRRGPAGETFDHLSFILTWTSAYIFRLTGGFSS